MTLDQLLDAAETGRIGNAEVHAYCANSGASLADALDEAARVVATRYAAENLDFTTADHLMNELFGYAAVAGGVFPKFMFSVFQAFDAGEFYPDSIREPSPEERFTRPQIAAILERILSSQAGAGPN